MAISLGIGLLVLDSIIDFFNGFLLYYSYFNITNKTLKIHIVLTSIFLYAFFSWPRASTTSNYIFKGPTASPLLSTMIPWLVANIYLLTLQHWLSAKKITVVLNSPNRKIHEFFKGNIFKLSYLVVPSIISIIPTIITFYVWGVLTFYDPTFATAIQFNSDLSIRALQTWGKILGMLLSRSSDIFFIIEIYDWKSRMGLTFKESIRETYDLIIALFIAECIFITEAFKLYITGSIPQAQFEYAITFLAYGLYWYSFVRSTSFAINKSKTSNVKSMIESKRKNPMPEDASK